MKNIYILPTDKPSRIVKNTNNQIKLTIQTLPKDLELGCYPQYIYITSDEKIKELDWFLNIKSGAIGQHNGSESLLFKNYRKIILTTDQDLIKDGVQSIDDEFLEWFVKNPSCEFVEVTRNKKLSSKSIWDAKEGDLVFNNHGFGGIIQELSNDVRVHILSENGEGYMEVAITSDNGKDTLIINGYKVYDYTDYKIIIPKEELKTEPNFYEKLKEYFETTPREKVLEDWNKSAHLDKVGPTVDEFVENINEERLMKIAHKILCDYGIKSIGEKIGILEVKKLMVKMANLQQEQDKKMYSEQDMQEYATFCIRCYEQGLPCIIAQDWFKLYKNK